MGFLTEILAVAIVWVSSFALCQFGVAIEQACPHAKNQAQHKTIARTPRGMAIKPMPIAVNAPASPSRDA
jgi:hypothetical protein